MPRTVPSQVVTLIKKTFPEIRDGFSAGSVPYLSAILSLINQIPSELITLNEDDYTTYIASISVIQSSINSCEKHGKKFRSIPSKIGIQVIIESLNHQ